MKKYIRVLIVLTVISTTSFTVDKDFEFTTILYKNDIDIDSKSLKGWIRLFNSKEKLNKYHIIVSEKERLDVLVFLRKEFEMKSKKFTRGIE